MDVGSMLTRALRAMMWGHVGLGGGYAGGNGGHAIRALPADVPAIVRTAVIAVRCSDHKEITYQKRKKLK
jgi:hypothetical protein